MILRKMETYHQMINILIQANQACPRLAGIIIQLNSAPSKTISVIPGNIAKVKILIRWLVLMFLAFLVLLRILILQFNKKEELNTSKKVYIFLCIETFFMFTTTGERYRIRGYFPDHLVSFVNSLFVMEEQYFRGKI